jgi:hypothetical protein
MPVVGNQKLGAADGVNPIGKGYRVNGNAPAIDGGLEIKTIAGVNIVGLLQGWKSSMPSHAETFCLQSGASAGAFGPMGPRPPEGSEIDPYSPAQACPIQIPAAALSEGVVPILYFGYREAEGPTPIATVHP